MKHIVAAIVVLGLIFVSAGAIAGNCRQSGNAVYCDDGTSYRQSGNTVYGSDGSTYRQSGNTTYGSDGTGCCSPDFSSPG